MVFDVKTKFVSFSALWAVDAVVRPASVLVIALMGKAKGRETETGAKVESERKSIFWGHYNFAK